MRLVVFINTCLLGLLGLAGLGASQFNASDPGAIDDQAKAAYYVLRNAGYVFALNVVENGDVYYHMNAPASHSWMGIGFGSTMTNTRMLISYISTNGANITNTCRMATGRSEPVDEPDIVIDGVYSDTYAPFANTVSPDGLMIAHAICRNCSKWSHGEINVNDTAAQFIFALGPNVTLNSDSRSADLTLHQFHGTFTMDMTVATNFSGDYGRVPAPQDPGLQSGDSYSAFANYYSSIDYNVGTDTNWGPTVHGVFMCLAFLLVFPSGALMLRLTKRAFLHAAVQVVGMIFIIIGFAIGIYVSTIYNKSKHFNAAHQVIGFLILAMLLIQVGLGLSHHRMYVRTKTPTIMGAIHRFLGMFILVLGLVNAGVGFNFAGNAHGNIPYGIVAGIMVILFAALIGFIIFHNRRSTYKPESGPYIPSEHYLDDPDQYEMQEQPFNAAVTYVQTPRTPRYAEPSGSRADPTKNETLVRQNSLRLDTASTSRSHLVAPSAATKWDAIAGR